MQIKTNRKAGFTLVEIMIVVAIIGLLAAIAIPNFVKARETAQLNSIVNNLRIIEGAKDQWALELKKGTDPAPRRPLRSSSAPTLLAPKSRSRNRRILNCKAQASAWAFFLVFEK